MHFGVCTVEFKKDLTIPPGQTSSSWAMERSSGKIGHAGKWGYFASTPPGKTGDIIRMKIQHR